jgi:hypothetical protein
MALCGTVVLTGWFVGWHAGFDSAVVETTGAMQVEDRAALPSAGVEVADAPQATPICNAAIVNAENADVAPATAPETAMAAGTIAAPDEPNTAAVADEPSIVEAALPDSSPIPAPELPLVQVASANSSDPAPELPLTQMASANPSDPAPELPLVQVASANPSDPAPEDVKQAVARIEILDECLVVDICIDQYLWALYQRTLKQDTNKVHERRKVTVKRKGKMVTVTRSFTKLVNQDFTWKDPNAAERVGMPMMDYVIGGMDRSFKTKLFHTLHAAEQAGLSPGITSAFRDDYRQSIASGMKAAANRSFHGGSLRGGYGHGLAADVVSVDGATRNQRWVSTEKFWKWIDANGKQFGIGRPYLGRDPPHVAPIDGREYAAHNPGMRAHAQAHGKKSTRLATRDSAAKTPKKRNTVQASSPVRNTKQGAISDRPRMAMAEPGRG